MQKPKCSQLLQRSKEEVTQAIAPVLLQAQRLAPVKLEEVHQKCIDANPVLPKEYLLPNGDYKSGVLLTFCDLLLTSWRANTFNAQNCIGN